MIDTLTENNKEYTKVENLKLWDKNPRNINEVDFERLKKQLLKLGQYKPILIIDDGTILGGNMRYRGYSDLLKEYKEIGIQGMLDKYNKGSKGKISLEKAQETINQIQKGIWISRVKAKTEQEKLEYALSDNDRAGYYDDDMLANLIPEYEELDWADYSVDLQVPTAIDTLLYNEDGLGDEFSLPDGDKETHEQATFTFSKEQAEIVKKAIETAKKSDAFDQVDMMGNENSNGNAMYLIVKQWMEQN